MKRAAVLIGVRRSGALPELQAVDDGIDKMEAWALAQGIDRDLVVTVTDRDGSEVERKAVFRAIKDVVDRATVEQLVVYFAGHGVNLGQSEYWLLSGAPEDPEEAINVAGSVKRAQRCGIPHVVVVSDACRTAPTGIQAQDVEGGSMFPNLPPAGPAAKIDTFYACLLGDPSQEIADPDESAKVFRSVYTDVLVAALEGKPADLLEPDDDPEYSLVRPHPLETRLPDLVAARLKELGAALDVSQIPDATVTSPEKAWVSRLGVKSKGRRGPPRRRTPTLPSAAGDVVRAAVSGDAGALDRATGILAGAGAPGADAFVAAGQRLRPEFGPLHFETECGFKLRGDTVARPVSLGAELEVLAGGGLVRVTLPPNAAAANVLFELASDRWVLLPAVRGFLGGLTFDAGQLVDVAYQPSEYRAAGDEYRQRADEILSFRTTVAVASRFGLLKVRGSEEAAVLADRIGDLGRLDPSLAVYGAYALDAAGREDLVPGIRDGVRGALGVDIFDLALLSGAGAEAAVRPPFPLLSRGWALLDALEAGLAKPVANLSRALVPSVWTLFDGRAEDSLRHVIGKEPR